MKYLLTPQTPFPPAHEADENGIVAVGGELTAKRLLEAYSLGIFPWPHPDLPLLWFCPDPRYVLDPKNVLIGRSLKKTLKTSELEIKADHNFLAVMRSCQQVKRVGQHDTWITKEMLRAYSALHEKGFAHSIEAYEDNNLVGGLYGVSLGSIFFGESMFFLKPNASKICFLTLVAHLIHWNFDLIDCQAHTENLERFGAKTMSRDIFLQELKTALKKPTKDQKWKLDLSQQEVLKIIA